MIEIDRPGALPAVSPEETKAMNDTGMRHGTKAHEADTCAKCEPGDGWICEQHPDKHWPHDDCIGPGMPCECGGLFRSKPDPMTST